MTTLPITHHRTLCVGRQSSELVERVNRLYHEWTAGRFDSDHQARHRVEKRFWSWVGRAVLQNVSTKPKPRMVLDVACGSGFVLQILTPFLERRDIAIGIDLSTASLHRAQAKTQTGESSPTTLWAGGSGVRLPIASCSVSLVTINASLHHFADPFELLSEMDRVLVPGGHLAMGFEPNSRHFQTSWLPDLGAAFDRIRWYTSIRQNCRRVRRTCNCAGLESSSEPRTDDAIACQISRQLVEDGVCAEQLPSAAVLDLVDVHARGEASHRGIDFEKLIASRLPDYEIRHIVASDYLGASMRMAPVVRAAVDAIGRLIAPDLGSLISCLLRKPEET